MNGDCNHTIFLVHPEFGARQTRKAIMDFLKQPLTNCPVCGGLVPELGLVLDFKKTYTLCCHEVREFVETKPNVMEDKKIAQQTDYKKLHAYLEATLRV